jgi:hypothetical protein
MATYYKYAERQADSFVNWGEIGKNLSEMLQTENQLRENKKAEIDKASREFGEQLANSPTGEHQGANAWTLNYASDAQQARLLQDRLLKSGQLKLKDYTIMRQNINDGTKQVFNLSKEYQEEYKVKMERAKSADPNKKSQAAELFVMGSVEGFANFMNSKILINPTDFQVSVGMMKPDPENGGVLKLTDDVETVQGLRTRLRSKYDYFNIQKVSGEIAGTFAEYTKANIIRGSDTRAGQVKSLTDAMQIPENQLALVNMAKASLTPENYSSILTEEIKTWKGEPFGFTYNKEESKSNPNLIFMDRDPQSGYATPRPNPEQEKAALDYYVGVIKAQIAHKEEIRTFSEPQKQLNPEVRPGFINPSEMYVNHINSIITPGIVTGNEDTARANISKAVANLGFTVEIPTRPGRDIIVIKNKDNVRSSEINLKDGAAALEEVRGFLLNNIPGGNFEAQTMHLVNLRNQGIIGGGANTINYGEK